ncbi:MAG: polysaccharide (de)acetylase [Flavobacterium psychrophilum]
MRNLKNIASSISTNIGGKRIDQKIVVIESDDWGSIRIPNLIVLNQLRRYGFQVDKCQYMLNDTLESNDDLEILFQIINSQKKKIVITANFLTANPNFELIRASNFQHYFNESVKETLNRYPNHDKVFELYQKGISSGSFVPQLHGREHLDITLWMSDLASNNKETRYAFDLELFGVSQHITMVKRPSYQAALASLEFKPELANQIISDASQSFFEMFGFYSKSFIAPNYVWGQRMEEVLSKYKVEYLQGGNTQSIPLVHGKRLKRNGFGSKNSTGQKYLIRNASFEPFSDPNKDWVDSCMNDIKLAFLFKKPAIISMHRVNFVGGLNNKNRDRNIKQFLKLVTRIQTNWPDVQFISSSQLGDML